MTGCSFNKVQPVVQSTKQLKEKYKNSNESRSGNVMSFDVIFSIYFHTFPKLFCKGKVANTNTSGEDKRSNIFLKSVCILKLTSTDVSSK